MQSEESFGGCGYQLNESRRVPTSMLDWDAKLDPRSRWVSCQSAEARTGSGSKSNEPQSLVARVGSAE
jgi:hypothetical protein